jgi:hypothetical protein
MRFIPSKSKELIRKRKGISRKGRDYIEGNEVNMIKVHYIHV